MTTDPRPSDIELNSCAYRAISSETLVGAIMNLEKNHALTVLFSEDADNNAEFALAASGLGGGSFLHLARTRLLDDLASELSQVLWQAGVELHAREQESRANLTPKNP